MAVRFVSTKHPALELPQVPARFVNGVADLTDEAAIARMRYLGIPYGVREVDGEVDPGAPLTAAEIAAQIADPGSTIGAALRDAFVEA